MAVSTMMTPRLSTLPEELDIRILHELDAQNILTCALVCQKLNRLVFETVSLQYKLELAAAGMVDGSTPLPVIERLRRLRSYDDAWTRGGLAICLTQDCDPRRSGACASWWPPAGGVLPHMANGVLKLFRPPAPSRGVPQRTLVVEHPPAFVGEVSCQCVADVAQDLVGVVRVNQAGLQEAHLLSISGDGGPHPLAHIPILAGSAVTSSFGYTSGPQVYAALLGWKVHHAGGTEIHVFNWQTGELLWHHTDPSQNAHFFILDAHYILLASSVHLRIYSLERPTTPSSPRAQPICTLDLPRAISRPSTLTHFAAQHHAPHHEPPSPFSPDPDPARTLVAAVFAPTTTTATATHAEPDPDLDPEAAAHLLLVPASTLLSAAHLARTRAHAPPGARVPWASWGPHAHCLPLARRPALLAASGARAVLGFPRTDGRALDALILTSVPAASAPPSIPNGALLGKRGRAGGLRIAQRVFDVDMRDKCEGWAVFFVGDVLALAAVSAWQETRFHFLLA